MDLPSLLRDLRDSDLAIAQSAAAQIFFLGCALAETSLKQWIADASFARHVVGDASQQPQQTVGVAVEPANFERIRTAFRSAHLADVPPDLDALEFELDLPNGVRLDILTSRDPQGTGAIARYLQKFGEGIQQVELLVDDVGAAVEIIRRHFHLAPIYPATRAGAGGTRINFFLAPASSGGKVLIELVEQRR